MRPNARQRGYTTQWDREALRFRKIHPFCTMCLKRGVHTIATCVDHIVPHKGNRGLFWSRVNWQSLCTTCHNAKKQTEEHKGFSTDIDGDGYPIDERHPSNK